jgi:hypothetical protein
MGIYSGSLAAAANLGKDAWLKPPAARAGIERQSYRGRKACVTVPQMRVLKISISFDPKLGGKVREAARKARSPLSTWFAQAAAAKLRADALGSFLDDWEAKHGELTPDELDRATKELAIPSRKSLA